jgi:hypothetical protein
MHDFEKLGVFYLGRKHDLAEGQTLDELLLYDASDLTTHGVCVGMTGSGKTGLCISLLEEAALDGIPAIVIDPKGDMGNLMLAFEDLQPQSFLPWIDQDEATRNGRTPEEQAAFVAGLWRDGLAQWGQGPERLAAFRDAAEVAIYTPGSTSGLPVSVLSSFAAPPPAVAADAGALGDRIENSVSGLLSLIGIEADPVRSREHILLANILQAAWTQGRSLDLAGLIREIQEPPFERVGVFDLESFYPSKDRFSLAIALNNLLASPGFAAWLQGQPLDIPSLLFAPGGKPRISIMSIAHLSDAERMFFVTILLNEIVSWMRAQTGTSSLRALLYMDEIFGYFPPTAQPPSKKPMLTLLKQARAYGLGVLLATQNPVDLDYKGLANTGTWFIGRLQTERDKMRVLDGLEGASAASGAAFDRGQLDSVLSGLGKRVFLMHNVHEDAPVIFQTRWAMSYLRGPLTTAQIATLMEPWKATPSPAAPPVAEAPLPEAPAVAEAAPAVAAPALPAQETPNGPHADTEQFFLPITGAHAAGDRVVYRPALIGMTELHYLDARQQLDSWRTITALANIPADGQPADWPSARMIEQTQLDLLRAPDLPQAEFAPLTSDARGRRAFASWQKQLKEHLYAARPLTLYRAPALGIISQPGEDEPAFRGRLAHLAREQRDLQVAKLRESYGSKLARLQDRIRRADQKAAEQEDQYRRQRLNTMVNVGETLAGALFGRKLLSRGSVGRAATTARSASRVSREKEDITQAEQEAEALREELLELERELHDEVARAELALDPRAIGLEQVPVTPRKADINVRLFGIVWIPWKVTPAGAAESLTHIP